jgi:hypothetical protein
LPEEPEPVVVPLELAPDELVPTVPLPVPVDVPAPDVLVPLCPPEVIAPPLVLLLVPSGAIWPQAASRSRERIALILGVLIP